MGESGESRGRNAIGISVASTGMVLFALCSHQGLPWVALGAGALLMTAAAIGWAPKKGQTAEVRSPGGALGLGSFSTKTVVLALVGVGIGAGGGLLHRNALGLALQPTEGVQAFVVVACFIGATEELLYRGWLFGKALTFGWPAAVAIAAIAHAAYKTALFAWPAVPTPLDLAGIATWTVVGGAVLGMLRVLSGSLLPPMLAHVIFDFVVYRAVADAPWWVWG